MSAITTTLIMDPIRRDLYESHSLKDEMIFPLKDHPKSTSENQIREHIEVFI